MASQYRRRSLMLNTIAKVAQGNPTIITDSSSRRLKKLDIFGQSEQDSTTGAQLLSVDMTEIKLPYSVNGITFSDNGDGGIKVTGTATGVATLFFNDMINNLEDGETYSYNSDTELGVLAVSYNDGTPKDYIKTITVNKSKMISIKPYVQYTSGNTVNKVIYPMLNIGNSVKPFEPYTGGKPSPSPDYPQEIISKEVSEIKVAGKNLLDFTKVHLHNSIKNPYTMLENGYILRRDENNNYRISVFPCELKKGQTYSIKFDSNFIVGEEEVISVCLPKLNQYFNYTKPFVPNEDTNEIGIYLSDLENPPVAQVEITNIQLEYGSEFTSYEPYKAQTITLPEPITLRGVPVASGGNVTIDGQQYISDVIKEKDDVIGVERNAKESIFDGSEDEDWILSPVNESIYRYRIDLSDAKRFANINGTLLCNRGFYISDTDVGSCFMYLYTESISNPTFYFIPEQSIESAEQFKEYLATDNLKLVYLLETPTFEPLPEEVQSQYKALKSYYPNTVIQTGCWNEVTYSAKRGG